jgi:hypothetical protein
LNDSTDADRNKLLGNASEVAEGISLAYLNEIEML